MAAQIRSSTWASRLAAVVLVAAAAGLVVFAASSEVGCDPPSLLALLVAATLAAAVVVRLPVGVAISLQAAILLPAWLGCGTPVTAAAAFTTSLVGGAIRTRAVGPSGLGALAVLAGVVAGNLAVVMLASTAILGDWASERLLVGGVFMLAYWAGELVVLRVAERLGLRASARAVPRSSVVANLLLLLPGTVIADLMVTRGPLFFGPALLLLVAALVLIALYLSAETARAGVAGERARLQSIVAHAPEAIFAVGPDLALEWLNETAARLTGRSAADAVGRPCQQMIELHRTDGTLADHRDAFARAARTGNPVTISGTLASADGNRVPIVVSYTAVADASGGLQVGVGAFRESSPADEMDDRAADLGHELRSPLSTILGYARLMASAPAGTLDAANQAEFIARITESGDYMLRLVNNLLDLRRMESGKEPLQFGELHVEPFLSTALFMVRPLSDEKRISIALDVEAGLPPVVTDELLARRAVDNLLSNAVKYTPPGGSVRVRAERDGDLLAISVADTGIGLTDEEQTRLFERFFRGTRPEARQERGTGLGLALVREAARQLGGEVRVASAMGEGSVFTLRLPLRPDAATLATVGEEPTAAP